MNTKTRNNKQKPIQVISIIYRLPIKLIFPHLQFRFAQRYFLIRFLRFLNLPRRLIDRSVLNSRKIVSVTCDRVGWGRRDRSGSKIMMNRLFGKPKQESNTLQTLDKLNEVSSSDFSTSLSQFTFDLKEISISLCTDLCTVCLILNLNHHKTSLQIRFSFIFSTQKRLNWGF